MYKTNLKPWFYFFPTSNGENHSAKSNRRKMAPALQHLNSSSISSYGKRSKPNLIDSIRNQLLSLFHAAVVANHHTSLGQKNKLFQSSVADFVAKTRLAGNFSSVAPGAGRPGEKGGDPKHTGTPPCDKRIQHNGQKPELPPWSLTSSQ